MTIIESTASDSTYHSRHARRTLERAKRIGSHIKAPGSLLDVGCNQGITSAYMLDFEKAQHVTGIELLATTVDEALKGRSGFTLLEGNVVELKIPGRYDHIVYGAVHHHILNLYGLSAAVHTFQKLAMHCNEHLFFETGQIVEGGRWGWQGPMRGLFRTDEEHFFYMLRSIEHLISGFEEIGSFWIHGIRRHYLRIDIRQRVPKQPHGRLPWPGNTEGPYVRSHGSRNQVMQLSNDAVASDSPSHFWIADVDDQRLFIKKHVHMPAAADDEWAIGRQLEKEWAVRPVARLEPEGAIAYPYLDNASALLDLRTAPSSERYQVATAVAGIYEDVCTTEVKIAESVLLAIGPTARLIDVIDLHAANFLVLREGGRPIVKLIDYEPQSQRYAPINRIRIAKIFWTLRQRQVYAALLFLRGLAGVGANLVRYQFAPFTQRVVEKQPSLTSLVVADIRTFVGRITARLLRIVGLN